MDGLRDAGLNLPELQPTDSTATISLLSQQRALNRINWEQGMALTFATPKARRLLVPGLLALEHLRLNVFVPDPLLPATLPPT